MIQSEATFFEMSCEFSVFSPEGIRSVIWFCYKLGKTISQTKHDLDPAYGDKSPSLQTVGRWYHRFEQGSTDASDLYRSGRPSDAEAVDKISEFLEEQPFASARAISSTLGLAKSNCDRCPQT